MAESPAFLDWEDGIQSGLEKGCPGEEGYPSFCKAFAQIIP